MTAYLYVAYLKDTTPKVAFNINWTRLLQLESMIILLWQFCIKLSQDHLLLQRYRCTSVASTKMTFCYHLILLRSIPSFISLAVVDVIPKKSFSWVSWWNLQGATIDLEYDSSPLSLYHIFWWMAHWSMFWKGIKFIYFTYILRLCEVCFRLLGSLSLVWLNDQSFESIYIYICFFLFRIGSKHLAEIFSTITI